MSAFYWSLNQGTKWRAVKQTATGRSLLRAWCLDRNIVSVGERDSTSSRKVFDGTLLAESNRTDQMIQILNRVGPCWPHVISAVQSQDLVGLPSVAIGRQQRSGPVCTHRLWAVHMVVPVVGPAKPSLPFSFPEPVWSDRLMWRGTDPPRPATEFQRTRVPGLLSTAGSRSYSGESIVGAAGESRHLTSRWRGAAVGSYPFGFGARLACRHGKMPRDSCGAAGAGFHGQKWSRISPLFYSSVLWRQPLSPLNSSSSSSFY